MINIILYKQNEVFMKVDSEDAGVLQEMSDYFTFKVPGAEFMPSFRNKMWDGKIRLFNMWTQQLYIGLLHHLEEFCQARSYNLIGVDDVITRHDVSVDDVVKALIDLKLPFNPRNYQVDAIRDGINKKRMLMLSPTGSGKSLIIYGLTQLATTGKTLVVVPTTSLVEQMYKDFKDYGYDVETNCHKIYSGHDKNTDKRIVITTWQSVYKLPRSWFDDFAMVIADEAHLFKATSLKSLLEKCVNAGLRFGTTGTLDGTKTHKLMLEGLLGPVKRFTTSKQLMKEGNLASLKINCVVLDYPEEIRKQCKKYSYQEEMDFIVSHEPRNRFIRNLAIDQTGNTLLLFQYVEKHGDILYKMIKEKVGDERHVFFVYGGVDAETREKVREITEKENDAIIVASYGTFSTGVNIRNLHNIIFASPSKSRIRNLQSIGRGLRLGKNKDSAVLYDISDDLSYKAHRNYTLEHAVERIKTYNEEKFKYKQVKVKL
jgi:superfamily II DNA or RNA helicase